MKFAYADPPYLGLSKFYAGQHPDWQIWDNPEAHRALIVRLADEYPDGWALSLHSPALRVILPMCPEDVRVCAWVKPFASWKPNVHPAYCWEPVILRGGRKPGKNVDTTRDYVSANITLRRGFIGAKPDAFAYWVFALLGAKPTDEMHDLFPGSGAITRAWQSYQQQETLDLGGAA